MKLSTINLKNINTENEISKRLLKSFSVKSLKEHFSLTDSKLTQSYLIEDISSRLSKKDILNVMFQNFSIVKQHAYLYSFKGTWSDNWLITNSNYFNHIKIGNTDFYNFVFNKKIPFYNFIHSESGEVNFDIAVQIIRYKTTLIISFNIVEQNVKTIVGDESTAKFQPNFENIIKESLFSSAPLDLSFSQLDLNKGIKKLWELDEIDAINVKYKKATSTSIEIMDIDKYIKKNNPIIYKDLINNPLKQTVFVDLKTSTKPFGFVCNPEIGYFAFSIFPENQNFILNLLKRTLDLNL